ncbi:MAG TPA: universal stress protein [Terriglobales bacterium]|nr:universal stress protein [Terriglobales bacterium]
MATVGIPTRVAIQNILLATDFSSFSDAALPFAAGLAHRYGSTLYLVNVVPSIPFDMLPADPLPPAQAASARMRSLASSDVLKKVPHKECIEQGDIAHVLKEMVRMHHIDLIVLGTHGRKGIDKLLMGSVAEDVFRHATCPVLTIGPHVTHRIKEGELRHILYATDFGEETRHGLPYALSLAEEHHAKMTLLHVSPEPSPVLPEPEPGAMPTLSRAETLAYNEAELRKMVPSDAQLTTHPEFLVEIGDVPEIIVEHARKLDADIVVLGVKRPMPLATHLTTGIAYKVVCAAPCPVLTVGHEFHA